MARGLTKEEMRGLVEGYRVHDKDTGSPEVQIAVLSERIKQLTAHVQTHKKDNHTRLGLLKLVSRRNRLVRYLKREDFDRYKSVVERLGIRG